MEAAKGRSAYQESQEKAFERGWQNKKSGQCDGSRGCNRVTKTHISNEASENELALQLTITSLQPLELRIQ